MEQFDYFVSFISKGEFDNLIFSNPRDKDQLYLDSIKWWAEQDSIKIYDIDNYKGIFVGVNDYTEDNVKSAVNKVLDTIEEFGIDNATIAINLRFGNKDIIHNCMNNISNVRWIE